MEKEARPVFTNIRIYWAIAEAAYEKMSEFMEKNVEPHPDGTRNIKILDPRQTSFKEAMISIVFSCIWLEAMLHLLIVQNLGKEKFEKLDKSTYEKKLRSLGCHNNELLENVTRLRNSRRELVHEKAFLEFRDDGKFVGELKVAQNEAENAREVIISIREWCKEAIGMDPA